jgi:hypothetical protein
VLVPCCMQCVTGTLGYGGVEADAQQHGHVGACMCALVAALLVHDHAQLCMWSRSKAALS